MQPDSKIEEAFRLQAPQKSALKKLGIETVAHLLHHFPSHYSDAGEATDTRGITPGEKVVLFGKLKSLKARKAWRSRVPMAEGVFEDAHGRIKVVWFNQPYIAKMASENQPIKLEGKVASRRKANGEVELSITNPEFEKIAMIPEATKSFLNKNDPSELSILPTYPESKGITSRWFFHAIQKAIKSGVLDQMEDPIPPQILKRYNLPNLRSSLLWIHVPRKTRQAEAARKRFAFEEVFVIQLANKKMRRQYESEPSFKIGVEKEKFEEFTKRFPFKPTKAQERTSQEIFDDFEAEHAMSRLLEGDVGSGKTFVAAVTAYAAVTTRPKGQDYGTLQTAYMAPTEILAKQHFQSFIELFSHPMGDGRARTSLPIQIGLITGSGCKKFPSKVDPSGSTDISRPQFLKWVANGEIAIVIGTHALIQKTVEFKHLAYVIIDEQHRFGTRQRKELTRKQKELPHLLSMTATPIPRTLALTIYGDLDLSLLDEVPKGRKKIETSLVPPKERPLVYEKIREEIASGRQAYVICPRIEAPDPDDEFALQVRSVEEETERLGKEVFPELNVESLHGKMKPKEKEEVMERFSKGEIDILVSTSVIEVGVNVPNATAIIIEGAERFGLAQLHQLRGRVQRSSYQPHCFLFTDSKSERTTDRLKALESAKNGFELAELDLSLRGAGELAGGRQWGISDIGMEAIKNLKLVEAARNEAKKLIEKDGELAKLPALEEKVSRYMRLLHLE